MRVPNLAPLVKNHDLSLMDTRPLVSAQAIWAELLTGARWDLSGCSGYCRPGNTLLEREVFTEQDLVVPVTACMGETIVVNMPIMTPGRERFWLADGSLPAAITVSPENLLADPLFCSYKPRPEIKVSSLLADITGSISALVDVECLRLQCALKLLRDYQWRRSFVRVTIFDQLAHLLGPDFLSNERLKSQPQIQRFLQEFDSFISCLSELLSGEDIVVVSAYGHQACQARVNINKLLAAGGFRQPPGLLSENNQDYILRRTEAVRNLAGVARSKHRQEFLQPMVASVDCFDPSATRAASPVYGTIYLNSQDRFENGIVAMADRDGVLREVKEFMSKVIMQEFGQEDCLWEAAPGKARQSPDLMLYVEGVEFHDSVGPEAIDRENYPPSCHAPTGFVLLPKNRYQHASVIRPAELGSLLMETGK